MQFGAYTFVETRRDPRTGEPVDVDKSFADVLEQIELADRVGLDVFGLGEHHRPDYAVSAPAVALAAAAARTKRIWLAARHAPTRNASAAWGMLIGCGISRRPTLVSVLDNRFRRRAAESKGAPLRTIPARLTGFTVEDKMQ